jgi:hypothetical protein
MTTRVPIRYRHRHCRHHRQRREHHHRYRHPTSATTRATLGLAAVRGGLISERRTKDTPHRSRACDVVQPFAKPPTTDQTTRGSSIFTNLSLAPRPRPRPTHPRLTVRRKKGGPIPRSTRATTSYPFVPSWHRFGGATFLYRPRGRITINGRGGGFHPNVGNRRRSESIFS